MRTSTTVTDAMACDGGLSCTRTLTLDSVPLQQRNGIYIQRLSRMTLAKTTRTPTCLTLATHLHLHPDPPALALLLDVDHSQGIVHLHHRLLIESLLLVPQTSAVATT